MPYLCWPQRSHVPKNVQDVCREIRLGLTASCVLRCFDLIQLNLPTWYCQFLGNDPLAFVWLCVLLRNVELKTGHHWSCCGDRPSGPTFTSTVIEYMLVCANLILSKGCIACLNLNVHKRERDHTLVLRFCWFPLLTNPPVPLTSDYLSDLDLFSLRSSWRPQVIL